MPTKTPHRQCIVLEINSSEPSIRLFKTQPACNKVIEEEKLTAEVARLYTAYPASWPKPKLPLASLSIQDRVLAILRRSKEARISNSRSTRVFSSLSSRGTRQYAFKIFKLNVVGVKGAEKTLPFASLMNSIKRIPGATNVRVDVGYQPYIYTLKFELPASDTELNHRHLSQLIRSRLKLLSFKNDILKYPIISKTKAGLRIRLWGFSPSTRPDSNRVTTTHDKALNIVSNIGTTRGYAVTSVIHKVQESWNKKKLVIDIDLTRIAENKSI